MAWLPPNYNFFEDYPGPHQHLGYGVPAAEEPPFLFSLCRQPNPPEAQDVAFALRQALRNGLLEWRDRGGHSALWWGVHHGHLPVVIQLIHAGACSDVVSFSGRTLLMAAVSGSDHKTHKVLRWLLQRGLGGGLEARSGAGYTALWWAAFDDRCECARVLLAYGADVCACDANGVSCFDIATRRGGTHVEAILQESGRAYVLSKARRLNDKHAQQPLVSLSTSTRSTHNEEEEEEDVLGVVCEWVLCVLDGALFVELVSFLKGEDWAWQRH